MDPFFAIIVTLVAVAFLFLCSLAGLVWGLMTRASKRDLTRCLDEIEDECKKLSKDWEEDCRKLRNMEQRAYKKGWHEDRQAEATTAPTAEQERSAIVAAWRAKRGGAA